MSVRSNIDREALGPFRRSASAKLGIGFLADYDEGALHDTITEMAIEQILSLLISERDRLNRAIAALGEPARRRGRPPKRSVIDGMSAKALTQRRRKRTAAEKKAQAERMRAYWAAKKKGKK